MSRIDSAVSGAISLQQSELRSEMGIAIAAKQLDAQQMQGDAVVDLLEAAARIGKEPGRGAQFDSIA